MKGGQIDHPPVKTTVKKPSLIRVNRTEVSVKHQTEAAFHDFS